MQLLDYLPTTIAEADLNIPQDKILSYINHIKLQNIHSHPSGLAYTENQSLLKDSIFLDLKNTILDLSRNYLNSIEQIFEDIQISSSWAIICPPNSKSGTHKHANSYISGCFYLTEGSPIIFSNPLTNLWHFTNNLDIPATTFRGSQYTSFTPSSGKLLLFPSWLYHEIQPNNTSERISLAFNIIPKGEFGHNTAKLFL